MKSFELRGDSEKPDSFENHVILNALNVPIELSAAPTTSGGQLPKHGDNAYYSGKWYVNFFGNVYSFQGTLV